MEMGAREMDLHLDRQREREGREEGDGRKGEKYRRTEREKYEGKYRKEMGARERYLERRREKGGRWMALDARK